MSGPVRYKTARTDNPPRLTLDLLQTSISPVFTRRELLSTHAALVRVLITRATGSTRIAFDLAAAGPYTLRSAPDGLIVDIERKTSTIVAPSKPAAAAVAAPPAAGAPPAAAVPPAPPPAATAPAAPSRLEAVAEPLETQVRIPWVPLAPRVEDFLSPRADSPAARVTNFRQREPGDGTPVSEETAAYLSYDSAHLYAVFVCRDQPSGVRTHLTPREAISDDDQVALYLDTFHDGRRAYVFASNPLGVQQDGIISEGDDANYAADMVWRSEGRLTGSGYVVLIAIPFKTLRFSADAVQNWRIAVSRTIARRSESAFWPYISRHGNGFIRQMAALDGLELIAPGRNVQLGPYATFARADAFDSAAPGSVRTESRRSGLDAKVVVKSAVAIDATFRPDFSEVESDDPLVNVNQRFERFVPEKRPFFMENAALFETPINVFFSRRIADPDVGVRLTGRSTGWAAGGLVANDRAVSPQAPGGLFGPGAAIGVARLQRQFGERSRLGVLVTDRDDGQARSGALSVDARTPLGPSWSLSGQAVGSDDREAASTRQQDTAFAAALSRTGTSFSYVAGYRDVGKAFRVPLGFVPRTDVRTTDHYASYVWRTGDSGLWSVGPAVSVAATWDHAGQLQDRWTSADVGLSRSGTFDVHASRADGHELYGTTPFQEHTTSVSLSANAFGSLSLWSVFSWGAAIDYTPADGVAPFLGSKRGAYAGLTLRPSGRLNIEQMFLREQFDTLGISALPPGSTVYETTLVRWKANLQMTRSLAVRAILDYNQLRSQPLLFADPSASHLLGDLLVRFLLHPGTAMYVGFNSRYANLVVDPHSEIPVLRPGLPTSPVGQQLFVKLSYLFRL